MTHTEVIDFLAEHLQQSKSEIRRVLTQTTDVFKQILDQKDFLMIPRLGTFVTKLRDNRKAFHPQRRQFMILPRRRIVHFHAGASLRNHVKNLRVER